jgi:molybdopterin synthase catalytic subunit
MKMHFEISKKPIDVAALTNAMYDPRAGAFVQFEGRVRSFNDGKEVHSLEYEAYESLCLNAYREIHHEASQRYDILDLQCVHRSGLLGIGDVAVWVGVLAKHRKDAFLACEFAISAVKARLPIWKKEFYIDGNHAWIEDCRGCRAVV